MLGPQIILVKPTMRQFFRHLPDGVELRKFFLQTLNPFLHSRSIIFSIPRLTMPQPIRNFYSINRQNTEETVVAEEQKRENTITYTLS